MSTFKSYLNESKTKAEDIEKVIVNLWNGEKIVDDRYLYWIDTAKRVINYLEANGVSGIAKNVGRKKAPTTKQWQKYKKSKKDTPKTDIIIGKYKISIKVGSSQLIAAAKDEAMATFFNVIEKKKYDKLMINEIKDRVLNFSRGRTVLGSNPKKTSDPIIKEIDHFHKETQQYFKDMFKNNPQFMLSFIQEAISGEIKFGKSNYASANWILTIGKGDNGIIKFNKTNDPMLLSEIASRTSISVRFKSTSVKTKNALPNERNFWTVLMMVDKFKFKNESSMEIVSESKISRGIKKFLNSILSKLKLSVNKIFKFIGLEPIIKIK